MQAASPDSTLRPSSDVVARRLDRAGVLVHLPTNRIFELNETGMRIWELLGASEPVAGIVATLVREFDVDPERATREVSDLLRRFRDEGFAEP